MACFGRQGIRRILPVIGLQASVPDTSAERMTGPQLDGPDGRHHDAYMRTTLRINDVILRELRERAKRSGLPFRQVVEETLTLGLSRQSARKKGGRAFRVQPHPLGLKAAFRGLSLNQLYDQLEAEETLPGSPSR